MESPLRIREATPSELFAERLEREAQAALTQSPDLAADYRRQAALLREMAAVPNMPTPATFAVGTSTHR
jgi:hypothetical protein